MSDNTLLMFSSRSFTVLNPLYIILFVFGHVGSSLLDRLFSGCTEQELVILGLLPVWWLLLLWSRGPTAHELQYLTYVGSVIVASRF